MNKIALSLLVIGGRAMGEGKINSERGNFDKWEMHNLLESEDIGPCGLPETRLLSKDSLQDLTARYPGVYVKPVDTWGGQNISFVQRIPSGFLWTMQDTESREVTSGNILEHYQGLRCIVQQAVPLRLHDGSPFDVRVHMQREVDDSWVYAGELVRVGGPGIVSNIEMSNGHVLSFQDALYERAGKQRGIDDLQHKLKVIGHRICRRFQDYPHIDEVGIDLGVDDSQNIWVIEVNTNDALGGPSHELFHQLSDQTMYSDIVERWNARHNNTLQMFLEVFGAVSESEDES